MSTMHDVFLHLIDNISPHPDANTLSITYIDSEPVVFKTDSLRLNDLAVYFPIDSLLPVNKPWFEFLRKKDNQTQHRLKACRLRGQYSQGLLIPLTAFDDDTRTNIVFESADGNRADLRKILEVETYEEDEEGKNPSRPGGKWYTSNAVAGPSIAKYDIEAYGKMKHHLVDGETIVITEKIHGANARYIYRNGTFYAGSRTQWKKEDPNDMWWSILDKYPQIKEFLIRFPDHVLYGEVYGQVQDLKYGKTGHDFAAFDVLDLEWNRMQWHDASLFHHYMTDVYNIPVAPILYEGAYYEDFDYKSFAEGNSTIPGANHVREGFVLRPLCERTDRRGQRIIMKQHGQGFKLR